MGSRAKALCIGLVNSHRSKLNNSEALAVASKLLSAMSSYLIEKKDAIKPHRMAAIDTILKNLEVTEEIKKDLMLKMMDETFEVKSENEALHEFLKSSAEQEKSEYLDQYTLNLFAIFENSESILRYLSDFHKARLQSKIPLHDACLLEPPEEEYVLWTPSEWKVIIMNNLKHRDNFQMVIELLKSADRIEKKFRETVHLQPRKISSLQVNELKTYVDTYANHDKHPAAAKEFYKHGIKEKVFEMYLALKPQDDDKLIPSVTIQQGELTLQKLSSSDPRAAILGMLTGCCQSLNGVGHACAVYGIEKPNAGFYVITNKKGKIISQFFAWRDENNNIVFDSLESSDVLFGATTMKGKDVELVKALVDELLSPGSDIAGVYIGTGGRTPNLLGLPTLISDSSLSPPDGGNMYRDSKKVRSLGVPIATLCKHLQIPGDDIWWEHAAKKELLDVNDLMYCLLKCPIEQFDKFKNQINGKGVVFNAQNTPTIGAFLNVLMFHLDNEKCEKIIDQLDMANLSMEELLKIKVTADKKNILLHRYYNTNKKRDWDDSTGEMIITVEQLTFYVRQATEAEWPKCEAMLFKNELPYKNEKYGSIFDNEVNTSISKFYSKRWGSVGYVLSHVDAEKCDLICDKLKEFNLQHNDYFSIFENLQNEENKQIFLELFLKYLATAPLIMRDFAGSIQKLRPYAGACLLEVVEKRCYVGEGGMIKDVADLISIKRVPNLIDDTLNIKIIRTVLDNMQFLAFNHVFELSNLVSHIKSYHENNKELLDKLFSALKADIEAKEFKIVRRFSAYYTIDLDLKDYYDAKITNKLESIILATCITDPDRLIKSMSEIDDILELLDSEQVEGFIQMMLPKLGSLTWDNTAKFSQFLGRLNKEQRSAIFVNYIDNIVKGEGCLIDDAHDVHAVISDLNQDEIILILKKLPAAKLLKSMDILCCYQIWRIIVNNEDNRNLYFDQIKEQLTVKGSNIFDGIFYYDFFYFGRQITSSTLLDRLNKDELSGYYEKLLNYVSTLHEKFILLAYLLIQIKNAPEDVRAKILTSANLNTHLDKYKELLPVDRKVGSAELNDYLNITWTRLGAKNVLQWIDSHLNNPACHYSDAEKIDQYKLVMSHPLVNPRQMKTASAPVLFAEKEIPNSEEYTYLQNKIDEIRQAIPNKFS